MTLDPLPKSLWTPSNRAGFYESDTRDSMVESEHPKPSLIEHMMLSRIVAAERIRFVRSFDKRRDTLEVPIDSPGTSSHPLGILWVVDRWRFQSMVPCGIDEPSGLNFRE